MTTEARSTPEPGSRWRGRGAGHRNSLAVVERVTDRAIYFRLVVGSRRSLYRPHSLPLEKWRARYEPAAAGYEVSTSAYRRIRKEGAA